MGGHRPKVDLIVLDHHGLSPRGPSRTAGLVAVLTLALTLSACGSSGSSSSANGSGSNKGTTAPAGTSGSGGVSAKTIKVCDLLPVADVANASGLPLTKAKESPVEGSPPISGCEYTSADGNQSIKVSTHQARDTDSMKQVMAATASASGAKKVPGVGDAAYFDSNNKGLTALYGTTVIQVNTGQDIQQDVAVKLADSLHAKL